MAGRGAEGGIEAKESLAGSNKLEILLFSLGGAEVFAINVFKIKEVALCPKITRTPNMRPGVAGLFSLRGNVLPALDLGAFAGRAEVGAGPDRAMIVTEYNQSAQGFIVHSIDRIIRVDWDQVRAPASILSRGPSMVTALTETPEGKMVSILDVEQVLFEAFGDGATPSLHSVGKPEKGLAGHGFYVDDSAIARRRIQEVFDHLGVKAPFAENGREAWERLGRMAQAAAVAGAPLSDQLKVILTDAEMPEMDGYVLTRLIKADARFDGIPVVMHSSLSSEANRAMGEVAGVDGYVAKFDPKTLAETILSRWAP